MSTVPDLVRELEDGSENARRAENVGNSLGLDPMRTAEPTRDIAREAVLKHNIPIGSGSNGYYLINSQREFESVVGNLESRIEGLRKRINSLKKGWKRRLESRDKGGNWPK